MQNVRAFRGVIEKASHHQVTERKTQEVFLIGRSVPELREKLAGDVFVFSLAKGLNYPERNQNGPKKT